MKSICNDIQFLALLIILLVSCGGNNTSSNQSSLDGQNGIVKLAVKNSQSFNPTIEHGRIISYRVTISGAGIKEPIVAEFDGSANKGVITGIPVGDNRKIVVEAVNANEVNIRQGETLGVAIEGGKTAEVDVTLESIPIFTNLTDNNTIENTRLIFQVFSDPKDPVAIEDTTNDSATLLADASTSATEIHLDVTTGLGSLSPVIQPAGQHTYKVSDVKTGRFSTVTINLLDGKKRRGAPFFAAGDAKKPDARRRVSCGTH